MIEKPPVQIGGGQADARALICPNCGGFNIRHTDVRVFTRSEDQEHVVRTIVGQSGCSVAVMPNEGSGNPSLRRDGLVISFECEECGLPYELTLAQHKGPTLVEWRLAASPGDPRR